MLKKTVIDVLARERQCSTEEISLETRLEDLGVDSLKAITILYELEEQFDIEIPNEVIETITTVGDIINCLENLQNDNGTVWRGA